MTTSTSTSNAAFASMTKAQLIEALEAATLQIPAPFADTVCIEKDKGVNKMKICIASLSVQGSISISQNGETYDVAIDTLPRHVVATLLGYGIKQHLADTNVKGSGSLAEYRDTIEGLYMQGYTSKREKEAANKPLPEAKAKGVKVGALSREAFELWAGENIEDGESIMQSLAGLDTQAFWLFMGDNAREVVETYKAELKAKAEEEAKAKASQVAASLPSLTFKLKA